MAMKTLFLGGLAARVAPRILGKMTEKFDASVLAELTDVQRLIPALADAEIVVGHIWRSDFPEAPRLKLLQAATAGVDMIDLPSLPRGITLCNVLGRAPACRRIAARRAAWQNNRHRRVWQDRPRGREARGLLRLQDHRRQSQPDRG
ncbi:MAG: hypothetical protein E6G81_09140 [Alphaproteobacteria bacterium]|nr:MAG: hypothetical protein E6G81_09140 [Alphaproteobacteria bacterium]